MAVATMKVPTVFTAVDKFSDVVSRMTGGVNKFSKTASSAVNRVDNKINRMWDSMNGMSQLAIGGGIGGLFYYAGKDIADYEVKIASLAAVTGTKIGAMNSQIESLGKSTQMSVIDIAGAFEIVGSKMSQYLQNSEALQSITDASITLSRSARMELEPAISSLTTMMNIYKLTAEDASYAVNKLSAGETIGSKSISETAGIIPQFGAQAVRANVNLQESIALVQTLAQSLPTEGIGRGLRNILFDISSTKTWDKNRWKAIKMAGIDYEFVTNNANKLVDRLRELKKLQSVKGGTELFFKRVNSIAANTLFQNFDNGETSLVSFLDKIDKINDASDKAAKNTSTLSSMIDKLKASFTNFIVTGDNANGTLGITKSLIGWMTDNMGTLLNLVQSVVLAFVGWKTIVGIIGLVTGVQGAYNAVMKAHLIITQIATYRAITYSKALRMVAVAQWTAYWPALLIIGALGLLAYAFWDTGDAAETSAQKQLNALTKQNNAYKNSTTVVSDELQKQKDIISKHNAKPSTAIPKSLQGTGQSVAQQKHDKIIRDLQDKVAMEKYKKYTDSLRVQKNLASTELYNRTHNIHDYGVYNKRFENDQLKANNLMYLKEQGMSFNEIEKIYPNLTTLEERKQQLEIIIKDPGAQVQEAKLDGKTYGPGVPVILTSTKKPKRG